MDTPPARRKVNIKAVVILLLVPVLLGVSAFFVRGFQVRRNAGALKERAEQEEKAGDVRESLLLLEMYLGLAPEDVDALVKYGRLLRTRAKTFPELFKVYQVFETALRIDGQRHDVRLEVAEVSMALGRISDARLHLNQLDAEHARDPKALRLIGRCDVHDNKIDEARKSYKEAVRLAPRDVELRSEYVILLREYLDLPFEATHEIKDLVETTERSPEARLAALRFFARYGAWMEADEQLGPLLQATDKPDVDLLMLAAKVAGGQRQDDRAKEYLATALKLYPDNPRVNLELARIALRSGDKKEALNRVNESMVSKQSTLDDIWEQANLLIDLGHLDRARELLEQLRVQLPVRDSYAYTTFLEARMALSRGEWAAARDLLLKVVVNRRRVPELALAIDRSLVECYGKLGNFDAQLTVLERILKSDPSSAPARRAYADTLTALGRTDDAIVQYRALVDKAPELKGQLGRLLLARNLRLPVGERRWEELDKLLDQLEPAHKQSLEIVALQADVLLVRQRPSAAREIMEKARDANPKDPGPWIFLVVLTDREGPAGAVLPLIDEAEKTCGRNVDWEILRLNHWLKEDMTTARQKLPKLEAGLTQWPEKDQRRLVLGLARGYAAVGESAASERLYRQAAEADPKNLDVRVTLLELAFRGDRPADVQHWLGQVQLLEGAGGAVSLYGEAALGYLRARKGDRSGVAEARQRLDQAAKLRPTWSAPVLLQAEFLDLENRRDLALEKYLAALDRGENRLVVVRRIVQLLNEQGRYLEADALVRRLPERALAWRDLGRIAAETSLLTAEAAGQTNPAEAKKRALELARKAVAEDSKDIRDYIWLGEVAALAGEPKEAEAALRKAVALEPKAPASWVALLFFLIRTDQKRAQAELELAQKELPRETLPKVLAPCYEVLGRYDLAEEQYQTMVKAKPDDALALRSLAGFFERTGQLGKAEPHLRRLIDPTLKAPDALVAWGRRLLAFTIARGGNQERFQEAMALLDQNVKSFGQAREDQRARALVLTTRPGNRREAITLLEALTTNPSATPPDILFYLAQLYEAEGNWSKAQANLIAALEKQPQNAAFLMRYIGSLLRRGEADLAQRPLQTLVQILPDHIETIALQVAVLQARGRKADAVQLVQGHVKKEKARLEVLAFFLEQLGETAEAEQLLREYVARSKNPNSPLLLAQFYARQKRPADALPLCEAAWKDCAAEDVAGVCLLVFRVGATSADQKKTIEKWMLAAQQKNPKSLGIVLRLAELQDVDGRHDQAMAIYRQVLRQDERNLMALNNLAYLLVLKSGSSNEALELINRAIEVHGPHPAFLDSRAVVYLKNNQPDLALKDSQRAVVEAPTPAHYFHLAQAHLAVHNRVQANEAYRRALLQGLKAPDLHPLEQPALKTLADDLDPK